MLHRQVQISDVLMWAKTCIHVPASFGQDTAGFEGNHFDGPAADGASILSLIPIYIKEKSSA